MSLPKKVADSAEPVAESRLRSITIDVGGLDARIDIKGVLHLQVLTHPLDPKPIEGYLKRIGYEYEDLYGMTERILNTIERDQVSRFLINRIHL